MVNLIGGKVTQTRLRKLLRYDPETGVFRWAIVSKGRKYGAVAGQVKKGTGYRYITVDGAQCRAGRLAWYYVHGSWPEHEIDHMNGNRSDDRIANLRDVPHTINRQNQRHSKKDLPMCVQRNGRGYRVRVVAFGISHESKTVYSVEAAVEIRDQYRRTYQSGRVA